MAAKWSKQRVAENADWEGGVFELYQWGLRGSDIEDPELAEAWDALALAEQLIDAVEALLPDPE